MLIFRTIMRIIGFLLISSIHVFGKECEQKTMCSCTIDGEGDVDITSLGNTDQTPRFKDVLSKKEGNYYSYNPCGGFDEGKCSNAASCILNTDKSEQVQIGDAGRTGFKLDEDSGNVIAAYTSGGIGELRLTQVELVCDPSACTPEMTAIGQQAGFFVIVLYSFKLKTVCACPGGCTASGPVNCVNGGGLSSLSVGGILCILFFSLLVVYFVAGLILMKFVQKKDGVEIIPNVTFWRILPVLVKSGFKFTFGKCFPSLRE